MKLEDILKRSTDNSKSTFSANAIKECCRNADNLPYYCKWCSEQIKHDSEALALLKFVVLGEQSITDSPLSFEDVEAFFLEI